MFKIKRINIGSKLPYKVYDGDAGFDVFSDMENCLLLPNEPIKFKLGFAIELPERWFAFIQEKSGMAINNKICTIGNIIDSTYRGECHAILCNIGLHPQEIKHGQKIAQMIIIPCYTLTEYTIADTLSETKRGENGFGSTGKK